jgi:hypothetical protein
MFQSILEVAGIGLAHAQAHDEVENLRIRALVLRAEEALAPDQAAQHVAIVQSPFGQRTAKPRVAGSLELSTVSAQHDAHACHVSQAHVCPETGVDHRKFV